MRKPVKIKLIVNNKSRKGGRYLLGAISKAVGGAVDAAKSAVSGAASAVSSAVSGAGKSVSNAASGASKSVSSAASGAGKTVSNAASGVSKAAGGAGGEISKAASKSTAQVGSQIQSSASSVLGGSKSFKLPGLDLSKVSDKVKSSDLEKGAQTLGEHFFTKGKSGDGLKAGKDLSHLLDPNKSPIEKVASLGSAASYGASSVNKLTSGLSKVSQKLGPAGGVISAAATIAEPTSSLKDKGISIGHALSSFSGVAEKQGANLLKNAEGMSEMITKNPLSSGILQHADDGKNVVVKDPGILSSTMEHAGSIQGTSKLGSLLSGASKLLGFAGPIAGGAAAGFEWKQAMDDEQNGHKFAARQGKMNAIGDGITAVGSAVGGIPGLAMIGLGLEIRYRPSDDPAVMSKPSLDETDVSSQKSLADYYGANHGLAYDYDDDCWTKQNEVPAGHNSTVGKTNGNSDILKILGIQ